VSLLGAPDLRLDADLRTEDGYLLQNEWPIYAFDAIPMAIVLVICAAWYVGDIVTKTLPYAQGDSFRMVSEPYSRIAR
jgi:hypothetical protein